MTTNQYTKRSTMLLFAVLGLIVLSCAGVSDITNLFATPTPTATNTFTPSPTSTITPSPTSTLTPTPLPTGAQIEKQADGSTVLVDYDNKYQLALSPNWLVIPFNKDDYTDAMEEFAEDSPKMAEAADAFRDMDPKVFRLVALNRDPNLSINTFVTNMNATAIENEILSAMPLEFVVGALEGSLEDTGGTVLTSGVNIVENTHGVDVQFLDTERTTNGIKMQQRLIVFQSNNKLIVITFTTLKQFAEAVFSDTNEIGSSIEYLK